MVDRCMRCGISGDEVRLFDAIYDGRMGNMCERCSIIENVPIIKKPAASQLRESEESSKVYDRMKRISGEMNTKEDEVYFIEDRLNELELNPDLEIPGKDRINLIDHFHWEIMKSRRRKCLSQKQLAEALGESEIAIQMIEKGKLPENASILIKKLEQFFQIRLRLISEMEQIMKQKSREPVLLDESGRELEIIPEESEESEDLAVSEESENPAAEKPKIQIIDDSGKVKDFNLRSADVSRLTVDDLKEIHKKKIEATRQEKIEEQKKIEERQRIIEARKEELRFLREKESSELDRELGGSELLRGRDKLDRNNFENFDR
jgi:ribosome-binding protein aMBF1 (putative translation factor)